MMGGILLGIAAAARDRWWLAGAGITLACLLKLYPLSLGMLLMLAMPIGFALRFSILLAVGMGLPFILQDPSYVARQYPRVAVQLDSRRSIAVGFEHGLQGFMDVDPALETSHRPICLYARSAWFRRSGRAGLSVDAPTGSAAPELLNGTMALGCCWMALCGPATESCTYILLAPTMAWCLLETWQRKVPRSIGALYVLGSAFLLSGAFVVIFPFGSRVQGYGPQPFGALILLLALSARAFTQPRRSEPAGISFRPKSDLFLPGKAA